MQSIGSIIDALKTGGPVMLLLCLLSYVLYWQVISLLLYVSRVQLPSMIDHESVRSLAEKAADPDFAPTRLELLLMRYDDVLWQFREFIKNRLRFAGVLLVGAPLLGLLGTVLGMLDTFEGLSMSAGHQTTLLVAEGVKKSLITTQTGLTIAIPALFVLYWIRRVAHRRELELVEDKLARTDQPDA